MKLARRIGVLGAGQLALMLAEAAPGLDLHVVCAGAPGDCAARAAQVLPVDLTDAAAVHEFARSVDIVTVESENIDAAVLQGLPLAPSAEAIGIAQDRLTEKDFFNAHGLGTAPYAPIDSQAELGAALDVIGVPAILKTRRMGYDGRGQFRIYHRDEAEEAWAAVGRVPCVLEGFVSFDFEVSLLAARAYDGSIAFYPLVRNTHRNGILRVSSTPLEPESLRQDLQARAEAHMTRLLTGLSYVGVLAVEFFVTAGNLLGNEMAPRVHNSGHWTIEGSETSQFGNHLRAIAGLPLGSTASHPMTMLNCIGFMPPEHDTAGWRDLYRHDYGKKPRSNRKVGHLSFPASAHQAVAYWRARLEQLEAASQGKAR